MFESRGDDLMAFDRGLTVEMVIKCVFDGGSCILAVGSVRPFLSITAKVSEGIAFFRRKA
ncbi:hypothetical protein [Stieleria magnilauensis]|uniref:hypothetical protein n=1 Tax=Stieleria magnilauensis TaxID=2527963 RepID=UPI003AF65DC2